MVSGGGRRRAIGGRGRRASSAARCQRYGWGPPRRPHCSYPPGPPPNQRPSASAIVLHEVGGVEHRDLAVGEQPGGAAATRPVGEPDRARCRRRRRRRRSARRRPPRGGLAAGDPVSASPAHRTVVALPTSSPAVARAVAGSATTSNRASTASTRSRNAASRASPVRAVDSAPTGEVSASPDATPRAGRLHRKCCQLIAARAALCASGRGTARRPGPGRRGRPSTPAGARSHPLAG